MKTIILSMCFFFIFSSASYALKINDDAPLFSLRDSNGSFFYLSAYIGPNKKEPVKGIIVNFFSSTCIPCKHELPVLNSLVEEFAKKGVKVMIIGYREDFDKIAEILEEIKVDKPIILSDPYGKVGQKYGVLGLPLTVFIGADGKVKDIIKGELPDMAKKLKDRVHKTFK